MKGEIHPIDSSTANSFLLPRHYSGRKPNIKKAFALYDESEIKAVLTVGKPASNSLCVGICGKEHSKNVYELNRLCRVDGWNEPLSSFVSACLRQLKNDNLIIVSYADSGMNHCGYVYQACNFIYTGITKKRTDMYVTGGKHSRHYKQEHQQGLRVIRTPKHRYVYFCTTKRMKKVWMGCLNYPVLPYPKEKNSNYILGNYIKPQIVGQLPAPSNDNGTARQLHLDLGV